MCIRVKFVFVCANCSTLAVLKPMYKGTVSSHARMHTRAHAQEDTDCS